MKKLTIICALLLGAITGQAQTYGTAVPFSTPAYYVYPYSMDSWYQLYRMQQDLKAIRSEVETMNEGLMQQAPVQVPSTTYSNLPALMLMLRDARRRDSIQAEETKANFNRYRDTTRK